MTSLSDLPIRDDLRGFAAYGAPQQHVPVQLNVNENTHPIPEAVATNIVAALALAVAGINRYPDREFTELRDALACYLGHGLSRDNIWAANGSNEVLQHTLQAFGGPGRSVLGFPPTYAMHSNIARSTGTRWVTAERDAGYAISAQTVVAAIEREQPDVVFLCSPNNPTGTKLELETVAAAYDATPGIVLIDEAYAEFGDGDTALTLCEERPRLLVSRTMSKAFAFAGARLGYLAAAPVAIDALRLVRLPYHLSALTQAAALAALLHAPEMLAMVDDIKTQRERIIDQLRGLGFTPVPSESNFVLFGGVADPQATFQALYARGILIRDVGIAHHLRVTAGSEHETSIFLDAMAELSR
ncbi:MAG: histidinol-phosphate transaminase [Rhodoglobus sp.]